jgi:hypothetical protein
MIVSDGSILTRGVEFDRIRRWGRRMDAETNVHARELRWLSRVPP